MNIVQVTGVLEWISNKYLMQKRAGILFLCTTTKRFLLIHENLKWTVPTFEKGKNIFESGQELIERYKKSQGKLLPIELYLSEDKGFEYGTYICLVEEEFLTSEVQTMCWCSLEDIPKNLHTGLKLTITNPLIRTKIDTVLIMSQDYEFKNQ